MSKLLSKVTTMDAVRPLFTDGMRLLFGGFGGVGTPPGLVDCLIESGAKDIHLIGNDAGFPWVGIGKFVVLGRAASLIASHIGSNPVAGDLMNRGELKVEFCPQGILVERIRCGGMGLGGFLTTVGAETILAEKKQRITLDEKEYLLETPLIGEVAIVYARKADAFGNLVFDKTARNLNPYVAMAGKVTIAEADQIVETGTLDPEEVDLPGIFVHHVVPSAGYNWKWVWETQTSAG